MYDMPCGRGSSASSLARGRRSPASRLGIYPSFFMCIYLSLYILSLSLSLPMCIYTYIYTYTYISIYIIYLPRDLVRVKDTPLGGNRRAARLVEKQRHLLSN